MPGKVSMRLWAVGSLLGLITILCLPATTAADECEFLGRFKTLHDLIPDEVGRCTENAILTEFGSEQRTTNGILYWISDEDEVEFTNGLHTWVYGTYGLESIAHDQIAQLRGFMARALMKEAVEDYIIEHGIWGYMRLEKYDPLSLSGTALLLRRSGVNIHIHCGGLCLGNNEGIAITNHPSWQEGWERLDPNQEDVHHHTPIWLIEWLDLPYSEQWQIHQVSAEQMLLLQEVWLRRYHPLIVAAYADVYGDGAEYIQEKKDEGCFPTTPVIDLTAREGCRDSRKSHDYVRLVALWYVLHGYIDFE